MTTQTNIPTTMAPREQTYRQSSAGETISLSAQREEKLTVPQFTRTTEKYISL